jgi:aspartyl protease family protein
MPNKPNGAELMMRAVLGIAVVVLAASALVPNYVKQMPAPETGVAALTTHEQSVPQTTVSSSVSSSRSVVIAPSAGGHFRVEGRVDGQRIDFMVDTGASVIALTQRDAAMLGIHPTERDYGALVRTANGVARVAPVKLGMVEIDDIAVRNVTAVVMPPGASSDNLLGLSFLSRLHHYEYTDGKLVLEQ